MAVYSLKKVQKIPISLEEAWNFFSHPSNLAVMTPEFLNLKFTNELFGDQMYAGQLITYKVKPLWGISMYWMTEIIHVVEGIYFVDEQRIGPYSLWHHQHHFREIDGGVEVTDLVHYKVPGWLLGDLANSLFVRRKLEEIFEFRRNKLEELFGKWTNSNVLEHN